MSVNQWTPEINLPIIVIIIINKDIIFNILVKLFLNNLLFIIIELPQIHITIKVWHDGNDASKYPFISIGL